MTSLVCLLAVLLWPALSFAELIVCGSATKYRTHYYADPVARPPAPDCSWIDPEDTALMAAQQLLLDTVPAKHLKVVGGLLVEFTAQEKADLAAAEAAAAAARQLFLDELEDVTKCKFETLAELETALQARKQVRLGQLATSETNAKADAQALASNTVGNIRAKLDSLLTRQYNVHRELLDEMYLGVINIARCDLARSRAGR